MKRRDELQQQLYIELRAINIPTPVFELKFHQHRKWRFDFAWPDEMIALEIEGGTRGKSRHFNVYGFMGDSVKYTEAMILGWYVVRVNYLMLQNGTAVQLIKGVFEARKRETQKQTRIPTVHEVGKVEIAARNKARKGRPHLPTVRRKRATGK